MPRAYSGPTFIVLPIFFKKKRRKTGENISNMFKLGCNSLVDDLWYQSELFHIHQLKPAPPGHPDNAVDSQTLDMAELHWFQIIFKSDSLLIHLLPHSICLDE